MYNNHWDSQQIKKKLLMSPLERRTLRNLLADELNVFNYAWGDFLNIAHREYPNHDDEPVLVSVVVASDTGYGHLKFNWRANRHVCDHGRRIYDETIQRLFRRVQEPPYDDRYYEEMQRRINEIIRYSSEPNRDESIRLSLSRLGILFKLNETVKYGCTSNFLSMLRALSSENCDFDAVLRSIAAARFLEAIYIATSGKSIILPLQILRDCVGVPNMLDLR